MKFNYCSESFFLYFKKGKLCGDCNLNVVLKSFGINKGEDFYLSIFFIHFLIKFIKKFDCNSI